MLQNPDFDLASIAANVVRQIAKGEHFCNCCKLIQTYCLNVSGRRNTTFFSEATTMERLQNVIQLIFQNVDISEEDSMEIIFGQCNDAQVLFLPELAQYTDKMLLLENVLSFSELKTLYSNLPSVIDAEMPSEQLKLWAL